LPRRFFLFFDFAYNNPGGVKKAKEAAFHFLDEEVFPGDEIGLLSISLLKGLVIHEFLTTDHRKIRDAVTRLDVKDAVSGRASDIEDEYWRRMAEGKPPDREGQLGVKSFGELNSERQAAKREAAAILERITGLAKALRSVPGQKHFIFFSTGVPGSMIYGYQSGYAQVSSTVIAADGTPRGPDFGDPVLRAATEDMYRELAASGCSVFSFDTREAALSTPGASLFAYDAETFASGHRDIFYRGSDTKPPVELFRDDRRAGGYTIGRLSKMTGGEYFSNINDFAKNLDKVRTLTGDYYVIGYRLSDERAGKYHGIKVEVLREGCRVRAQSGYFDPKAFRDLSDFEKTMHLIELALRGHSPYEIPLIIPAVALAYESGGDTCSAVLARITPEAGEKFSGRRVEIATLFFDGQENLAGLRRIETGLSTDRERDVFAVAAAPLSPGRYDFRVVVRDLESGASAVASGHVEVRKRPPVGLSMDSPLLLLRGAAHDVVEEPANRESRGADWSDVYGYDRSRFIPMTEDGVPAGTRGLAVLVPVSTAGILAPRITLEAKLAYRRTGQTVTLPILSDSRTRAAGLEIHLLELSLPDAPAGECDFVLSAVDAGSGLTSEARIRLKIGS
jgi:VWFA-related protein